MSDRGKLRLAWCFTSFNIQCDAKAVKQERERDREDCAQTQLTQLSHLGSLCMKPNQSCVPEKDETRQEEGQAKSGQSKDSRDWGLANTFLKITVRFLKKLEIELPYDPAIPLLAYTLRKPEGKETRVPQCSSKHCL